MWSQCGRWTGAETGGKDSNEKSVAIVPRDDESSQKRRQCTKGELQRSINKDQVDGGGFN